MKQLFKFCFRFFPTRYDLAIYSTNQSWGGSEATWFYLVENLIKENKDIVVFCQSDLKRPLQTKIEILNSKRIKVIYYKMNNSPLNLLKIYSLFTLHKPKIAYISHLHAMDAEYWMSRLHFAGIPYINFIPLCLPTAWPNDAFVLKMKTLYAESKLLMFDSFRNMQLFSTLLGAQFQNQKKVLFNLNQKPLSHHSTENDFITFGMMARFDCNHKGWDIALEALSSLKINNWRLKIAGNGPHKLLIQRLVSMWKLQNHVVFDSEQNAALFFKDVDVALFPSRFEGTPLLLIDAIQFQKICVVNAIGGMDELIIDAKTGFVADHADSRSFAIALKKCLNSQEDWKEMRKNATSHLNLQIDQLDALRTVRKALQTW